MCLSFLAAGLWVMLALPPSVLAAVSVDPRDPPCTGSYDWLGTGLNAVDCVYAIDKFFNLEVAHHAYQTFEFTGVSHRRYTKLPAMRTPRRYTHGTCTLVVTLLGIFPSMDLPEPPKGPFKDSDISTFYDLHQAASRIQKHCVAWVRQAGYEDLGSFGSLGVFLMATNSNEERFIPPGVEPSSRSLVLASQQNQSVPLNLAEIA
ncbi:MAG: hypothetical protein Q9166_007876 [cf. Caloplaca sp. 2 TL-2023]